MTINELYKTIKEFESVIAFKIYKDRGIKLTINDVKCNMNEIEKLKKTLKEKCTTTWINVWEYFEFGTNEKTKDYFYCWLDLTSL